MIYTKGTVPLIYIEGASWDLLDEIKKVFGVLAVVGNESKAYAIFEPEANWWEVENDIKDLISKD